MGNFTHYNSQIDPYDNYRGAFAYGFRINPFAVTIENNRRLSLPFSVECISETETINRLRIQKRLRFSLELEFNHFFNNYFAFFIAPGCGYTYFPLINAGSVFLSLGLGPTVMIGRYVSLSIPVKAIAATKEMGFSVSVSCSLYPLGITKRSER